MITITNISYVDPSCSEALRMLNSECGEEVKLPNSKSECGEDVEPSGIQNDESTNPTSTQSFDPTKPFTITIHNQHVEGSVEFNYTITRRGNPVAQMFDDSDGQTNYVVFSNDIENELQCGYVDDIGDAAFAHLYDFDSRRRYIMINRHGSGVGGREGDDWGYEDWIPVDRYHLMARLTY